MVRINLFNLNTDFAPDLRRDRLQARLGFHVAARLRGCAIEDRSAPSGLDKMATSMVSTRNTLQRTLPMNPPNASQ